MIFFHIALFGMLASLVYQVIQKMGEQKILQKINQYMNEKNEKYYESFLKKYEKSKKIQLIARINIFYKINLLLDRANIKRNIFINSYMMIVYSVFCVIIGFHLTFSFFKMILLSFIISLPCAVIPFLIIQGIATYQEERMEKVFLNFLLQIKNYAQINNDITSALRTVETVEPLKSYINRFNIELNSGMKFEAAIEHLKEKVSIGKFKEFFSNLQYCYLYGGSFPGLIDKNYKMIADLQQEKAKRLEETKGARIVLLILMVLNIFVYITYIKSNYDNYLIMQRSFFGMAILYWNFISMWILIWLSMRVKKLDY